MLEKVKKQSFTNKLSPANGVNTPSGRTKIGHGSALVDITEHVHSTAQYPVTDAAYAAYAAHAAHAAQSAPNHAFTTRDVGGAAEVHTLGRSWCRADFALWTPSCAQCAAALDPTGRPG